MIWSTVISKNIFMISKYFICMNFRYILIFLCSWVISFFTFNKTAIFTACCNCFFISIIYFFVWSLKTYSKSFSPIKKKSNENSKSEITNDLNESIVDRKRLYFKNDWKNWTLNWSKKNWWNCKKSKNVFLLKIWNVVHDKYWFDSKTLILMNINAIYWYLKILFNQNICALQIYIIIKFFFFHRFLFNFFFIQQILSSRFFVLFRFFHTFHQCLLRWLFHEINFSKWKRDD